MYGREGEESSDESEDDFDASLLAIATAAEDELLLAQVGAGERERAEPPLHCSAKPAP